MPPNAQVPRLVRPTPENQTKIGLQKPWQKRASGSSKMRFRGLGPPGALVGWILWCARKGPMEGWEAGSIYLQYFAAQCSICSKRAVSCKHAVNMQYLE